MSTPDPIRLAIRILFNAVDHQEWSVLGALLLPQAELQVSNFIPFRGRDSALNYFRNLRSMKKSEHLMEGVAIEGAHGICWGRFTGTKNDGGDISYLFTDVLSFEDKKIRRWREYHCLPKLGA